MKGWFRLEKQYIALRWIAMVIAIVGLIWALTYPPRNYHQLRKAIDQNRELLRLLHHIDTESGMVARKNCVLLRAHIRETATLLSGHASPEVRRLSHIKCR